MSRALTVIQCESEDEFWWHVRGTNGQILATSEVYTRRASAVRAARSFIKAIAPAPVTFRYWVGLTPSTAGGWAAPRPPRAIVEKVRHGGAE